MFPKVERTVYFNWPERIPMHRFLPTTWAGEFALQVTLFIGSYSVWFQQAISYLGTGTWQR
jgi:hypothetical protein